MFVKPEYYKLVLNVPHMTDLMTSSITLYCVWNCGIRKESVHNKMVTLNPKKKRNNNYWYVQLAETKTVLDSRIWAKIRVWWIMQLTNGVEDGNHVFRQRVVTLNNSSDTANCRIVDQTHTHTQTHTQHTHKTSTGACLDTHLLLK